VVWKDTGHHVTCAFCERVWPFGKTLFKLQQKFFTVFNARFFLFTNRTKMCL